MNIQLLNVGRAARIFSDGYDIHVHFTDMAAVTIRGSNTIDRDRSLAAIRIALSKDGDGWIEVKM